MRCSCSAQLNFFLLYLYMVLSTETRGSKRKPTGANSGSRTSDKSMSIAKDNGNNIKNTNNIDSSAVAGASHLKSEIMKQIERIRNQLMDEAVRIEKKRIFRRFNVQTFSTHVCQCILQKFSDETR